MFIRHFVVATSVLVASASLAQGAKTFDAAAAFGARQSVADLTLSPDGTSVAYIGPAVGAGSALFTFDIAKGVSARVSALVASGKPERLERCHWVSNERLVCIVYGVVSSSVGLMRFSRVVAVDRSGGNLKLLSTRSNEFTRGYQLYGGTVIDWLPDQDSAVLMTRAYLPDDHLGSNISSKHDGLGVDWLDTRNLRIKTIEAPASGASTYLTDGRGTVRIMASQLPTPDGQDSGVLRYQYRKQGSREWLKLGDYNVVDRTGFVPRAVDYDLNVAYGLKKKDGREAIYTVALDGSLSEKLVYARPDVDVNGLIRIGRRNRVVGASYTTDVPATVYFDPDIEKLMKSLSLALPRQPKVRVVDSTIDERVLLVFAGSDDDPGVYYLFNRTAKELHTFLVARGELEGVTLAKVTPISYPAADGEIVPGYLTLPPGIEKAKGLPAIVLPHGGPEARDEWGFDWLSQYYAARGFAVLQPNFRGSAGYGDAWLQKNGFQSWRVAIGDVLDAGRWLVARGIADPAKLCVVGWSYGGYAALQSAVAEPGFFKAVVAIAPVTDLQALKDEWRHWSGSSLVSNYIGDGPHIREGSPARNADKIKVPVLLFHGALDRNVAIGESRLMAERLAAAGVKHDLVTWDDLDHYLDDSTARTQMLRTSDDFLRQAIGEAP
jgi:dienelactone hydrolase